MLLAQRLKQQGSSTKVIASAVSIRLPPTSWHLLQPSPLPKVLQLLALALDWGPAPP